MSAIVSLGLIRAIALHAAATRRADEAPTCDLAAEAEATAMDGLGEALAATGSTDDVAAVLAHAYDQGGRPAELGAQGAVMLQLVAALARRAFGGPLAA